jgi:hypothetical protein
MFFLQHDRPGFMHIYNRQNYSPINFNLVLTLPVGVLLRELVFDGRNQTIFYFPRDF